MSSSSRRRSRDYPLPRRGLPRAELTTRLAGRDIRHALRGGEITRLAHGLYGPGDAADAPRRHLAALEALTAGRNRTVSHGTAAQLLGISTEPLAPHFHLTSPRAGSRVQRSQLVIGHRSDIPADQVVHVHGLPTTSPARTWSDIALTSSLQGALIITDQVLRVGRPEFGEVAAPWATKDELLRTLEGRGSAPGARTARTALDLGSDASDSPQETILRLLLVQAGFPEMDVNVWLRDEAGHAVVQPDLSFPRFRVAVQYDSWEHHRDPAQMLKDVRRGELTEGLGWIEVRITPEHLRDGGRPALEKIARALRSQGWLG